MPTWVFVIRVSPLLDLLCSLERDQKWQGLKIGLTWKRGHNRFVTKAVWGASGFASTEKRDRFGGAPLSGWIM